MSNRHSYRCIRTYDAEDDDSSVHNGNSSKFHRISETSSNMDVFPETGMRNSLPSETPVRKSFRTRAVESETDCKTSFSYRKKDSWIYPDAETDEITRKNSGLGRRHSYRSSNYSFQPECEARVEEKTFSKDPKEEAMALLTELASNEDISNETSEILKSAAQQIMVGSKTVDDINQTKVSNTMKHPTADTAKKPNAAEKNKETLSAAGIKDKILQKVPFIKHTGGLFAYNGRTYVAVNTSSQLVGIVINQVDEKMFGLTSTNIFTSVLTMLQEDDRLIPTDYTERLTASEDIIAFKNTLLNVRTMKKISFDPWYITSYEINANYVTHPEPDVFMDFLNTSSGGDDEIADCITDFISYSLSGTNRGKMFFVLGNARESGKSSLAAFLQGIINEKYIFNVAPNEFKDRFALGGSRGRILNISMDLPSSPLHTDVVATIKKITGGDRLMSQEKNEKKEFGVSSMRLIFGSNHPVSVNPTDNNDSFWSRLQVIPFLYSVSPEDKDPHLVQKMLDERDDIVSYCIQKMPDIIERGYKLSPCQAAEDIKNEWRYGIPDDDSLESFCDTFVEFTGNEEDVVLATDIYKPYWSYCANVSIKPLRESQIKKWFKNHGVDCVRKRISGSENAQSVITGVRFLENT